jgi:DNA-directed RNA polymerase subunit beta'
MYLGFRMASRAGVSIGVNDMEVPGREGQDPRERRGGGAEIEDQYTQGLVTNGERYNKVVDIWSRANDQVAKSMMQQARQGDGCQSRWREEEQDPSTPST